MLVTYLCLSITKKFAFFKLLNNNVCRIYVIQKTFCYVSNFLCKKTFTKRHKMTNIKTTIFYSAAKEITAQRFSCVSILNITITSLIIKFAVKFFVHYAKNKKTY